MKKLLNIILAVGIISLITACTESYQNKLRDTAEQINRELPMDLGNGINMDSISYDSDDNTLIFHYSLSEEFQTISSMRGAHDAQRRYLTSYLSSQSGNQFTKLLVDAKANICLEYYGAKSGDKTSITFYSNEIKEILDNQEEAGDDRSVLSNLVAVSNAQCPLQLDGDDLVMTSVALGDENLEFYYSYNPDKYEFEQSQADLYKTTMRPDLQAELNAPGNKTQFDLMKKLNLGVSYTFEAEGREPVIFKFTPEEVRGL